jgi:hypothetical protein
MILMKGKMRKKKQIKIMEKKDEENSKIRKK